MFVCFFAVVFCWLKNFVWILLWLVTTGRLLLDADCSRWMSGGNWVTHSTSSTPNTARCLRFPECKRAGLGKCRRKNKHKCREHGYGKIQKAAGAIDSVRVCCCPKRFSAGNVSRHDCTYRDYIPPLKTAAPYPQMPSHSTP